MSELVILGAVMFVVGLPLYAATFTADRPWWWRLASVLLVGSPITWAIQYGLLGMTVNA